MKKHPLGQNPDFRKLFQQLNGQYSGKKPEDGQGEKDGTPEPERFDSNGNPVKKKKKRRRFAQRGKGGSCGCYTDPSGYEQLLYSG